jgi:hypothetical protein
MKRYKLVIDGSRGKVELTTKPKASEEEAKATGLKLYADRVHGENAHVVLCKPLEN